MVKVKSKLDKYVSYGFFERSFWLVVIYFRKKSKWQNPTQKKERFLNGLSKLTAVIIHTYALVKITWSLLSSPIRSTQQQEKLTNPWKGMHLILKIPLSCVQPFIAEPEAAWLPSRISKRHQAWRQRSETRSTLHTRPVVANFVLNLRLNPR